MSAYAGYQGQCIGRVLHFLHHYCGLHIAEHAIVSEYHVECFGKHLATYTFRGDVPVFTFAEQCFNDEQERKQAEAIADGAPRFPEGTSDAMRAACRAFCSIGDGDPVTNLIERYDTTRALAKSTAKAAERLASWIKGIDHVAPREAYVAAVLADAKALAETE